jgi:hypothetical protein
MRVQLRVHGEQFILSDEAIIKKVRADIRTAARAGGAFVRIGSGRAPEVLVTASTPVRIDTIPDEPEIDDEPEKPENITFVDIDSY